MTIFEFFRKLDRLAGRGEYGLDTAAKYFPLPSFAENSLQRPGVINPASHTTIEPGRTGRLAFLQD